MRERDVESRSAPPYFSLGIVIVIGPWIVWKARRGVTIGR